MKSGTLFSLLPLGLTLSLPLTSVLIASAVFFTQSLAGVSVASLQVVTPNEKRAQVSSYFLLFVNLLGYGSGAPLIAAVGDFFLPPEAHLGLALALASAVLLPLALLAVRLAWQPYKIARNFALDED